MTLTTRMAVEDATVRIAGRDIFVGGEDELLREFEALLGRAEATLVMTPNVDQVIDLQSDTTYRAAFDSADLLMLDGMPLVFLARALGAKEAQRSTGADLLPWAASRSAEHGWVIAITGGLPEVVEAAVERLRSQHPGSNVVAVPFPMIARADDPAGVDVVAELRELRPDVTFVCLGSPKQELWFRAWRDQLPPGAYVGAGAAVDFAAGVVRRAPAFFQRLSLEWVWRLAQEPRRLAHRYLVKGPRFLGFIYRSLRKADTP